MRPEVVSAATTWDHWLYVVVPFLFYGMCVLVLVAAGSHGNETNVVWMFFKRISSSLERLTGYPGWAMATVLSGLLVLGVAVVGLYWDVAFHIDLGRDKELFTPSHTMIVLGLGGLVYSAGLAVLFATLDRAPVKLRIAGLRVPWSAMSLAALGIGGVAAFPLDNLWHQAYGVDVTLWSPTHLQLVAGGSLAPIALWLALTEGRRRAHPTPVGKLVEVVVFGAILAGLSTFQGEFDFGVPQFQAVYLPMLVAVAAGFALVLARVALGPWGALQAAAAFIVLRGAIALLVGGALNHTVPRFPLYLVAALAVEASARALGTERRLRLALVAGASAGTVGAIADVVWLRFLDGVPGGAAAVPAAVALVPVAGMAAAVLGAGMSRALPGGRRVLPVALAAAGVALVAVLAVPLPRNVGDVQALVRLDGAGDLVDVEVEIQPPDAAQEATGFAVVSWQGGGRVTAALEETGPGRYVTSRPVPVTGRWKSVIGLQRDDEVMAAPIYLPADPEIAAPEIPALDERRTAFVRNTELLLREVHSGPAGAAVAAYSGLAVVVLAWVALFALCAVRLGSGRDEPGDDQTTYPGQPGDLTPRQRQSWYESPRVPAVSRS